MADVQYAIDIAANLSDGDSTAAQLDAIADRLSGAGAKSAQFEDAMSRVARQLDGARTASATANAALGQGNQRYGELERAANNAARAVERASQKGPVPESVTARAATAKAALDKYRGTLSRLESDAETAAAAQTKLTKTMANLGRLQGRVNDRLGDAATKVSTFRGALGDVGGPIGELGERLLFPVQALVDLRERFGSVVAFSTVAVIGFTAVAAAVVALTAAFVAGVVAVAAYAVKLGDARRSAELATEAFEALNPALSGLPWASLSRDTGLATGDLQGLAKQLRDAKVAAAELPAALEAAAKVEYAAGKGAASEFIADLKRGQTSVREFSSTVEREFGSIVERKMLSLEAQGSRLQQNIGRLFGGLDIEPVLKGFRTLVNLFDENTVAGRTMKTMFEKIFQPIINQARIAAFVVEAFFLGILIGAVRMYIALKPAIDRVLELIGIDTEGWALEDVLRGIAKAGEYLVPFLVGLVTVVGLAATAIGVVMVGAVTAMVTPLTAVAAVIATVVTALGALAYAVGYGVAAAIDTAKGALNSIIPVFTSVGTAIVTGIAAGIRGGAGMVVSAITGVANGAISAAKRQLGIASPSKVFAEIGEDTTAGFAGGVEDTAPAATDAMTNMVAPTPAVQRAANQGGTGGATPAAGASISGNTFVFNGVADADDAEARFTELFTKLLEGDASALAGGTA